VRGQKIGLFRVQNQTSQELVPILSLAFKSLSFKVSVERMISFFFLRYISFVTLPSKYEEISFSKRASFALILSERF